ncbi:MAG: WecB/TagA/CpsF family glycosyltransferase [Rhizobiaceae bacterium]|nr:WecB/TagA/CpsF family glycosyltransferase [Rhizobiaceae bacterium]
MRNSAILKTAPSAPPPADFEAVRDIGGIQVAVTSAEEATRVLSSRLDGGIFTRVAFLNAHCVNLAYDRPDYRAALADFMILPDGIGIDLASQLLYGTGFPENLNGTDFLPHFLSTAERPLRVALIGAAPGIAQRAAIGFAMATPRHSFLPIAHGYFSSGAETLDVMERLRQAKADVVLVALGVPRQELFVSRHITGEEATLVFAVGALLDFMAGEVPRAPKSVRNVRLEWMYRLLVEPRRLWKRYLLGNPRFMLRVLRDWGLRGLRRLGA